VLPRVLQDVVLPDPLAEAKKGCEDALKLHEAGDHKGSQTKVGEAIALTGKALK